MRACKQLRTSQGAGHSARWAVLVLGLMLGGAAAGQDFYYGGFTGQVRKDLQPNPNYCAALIEPGSTAQAVSNSLAAADFPVAPAQIVIYPRPAVAWFPAPGALADAQGAVRQRIGDGVIRALLRVVMRPGNGGLVETDQVVLKLRAGVDRLPVWQAFGVEPVRALGLGPSSFVVRLLSPEDQSSIAVANAMVEAGLVEYAVPDFFLNDRPTSDGRARPLFTETDPLFGEQWHLSNTGQQGGLPGADVGAPEAWDVTRGNAAVVVCVYDDAVDVDHEDLNTTVSDGSPKIQSQYDIVSGLNDARPQQAGATEAHGTSVSGVAIAHGGNGLGVAGIAPNCRLMAIRRGIVGGGALGGTVSQVVDGYVFARDNGAWIVNQSFGGTRQPGDIPPIDVAITDFATGARNGQGGILLASSGNSNTATENDNGLADAHYPSNHPDVWSVGASNNLDIHSHYSDAGSVLRFVAPSNDFPPGNSNAGITTTDIMGADGYSPTNYANDFGGTSSACPLASGVTALVFGLLPSFPRATLLQILLDNCDPIGNLPYQGGRNNVYGAGRLDAAGAAQLALSLIGTDVHLNVNTVNGAAGKPIDSSNPVQVNYTDPLDNVRTASVVDGAQTDIFVKPGTAVTFPAQVDAGATSRYVSENPPSQVITAEVTITADYFHQLRRDFSVAVQQGEGVRPILQDDNNWVDLTVTQTRPGGDPEVNLFQVPPAVGQTSVQTWSDAGSTYAFGDTASASDNDQQWISQAAKSGLFELNDPTPTASFFHQSRPRVRLSGTNSQSTVNTERRTLFGQQDPLTGLFGTFNEWCDNGSRIAFNETTTSVGDEPVRSTSDVHEFNVITGLDVQVTYLAEARTEQSRVNVLDPRVAANGRTAATVEVFVRDSQGNPLDIPVAAERVQIIPTPSDGVQIVNPTGTTDEAGRVTFEVTRNLPGQVLLTGTIDGEAIPQDESASPTDVIEFLRVMTVPLPVPGTYFLSFPITPDGDIASRAVGDPANSLAQIRTFNVEPQPAQMARLVDGTETYVLFGALEKLQPANPNFARFRELFRIEPGRGFFLRTNQPGSAELVGEWSTGTDYGFPMPEAGFHQLGNPQADKELFWSLSDFDVWENGQLVGSLDQLVAAVGLDPSAPRYVDPFVWGFTGTQYEQVTDPILPGVDGLKTRLAVFEGFFWRSYRPNLELRFHPGRGRSRAPQPVSPSNFGVQLVASVGEARAAAIVGSYGSGLRSLTAPPAPDGPEAVRLEVVTSDGTRAAGDWLGRPVTGPTDWTVAVTTPAAGSDVTLSWPHLNRQLPDGYKVRLTDPTSGRSQLMNSSSSYAFTTSRAGESRQFTLTVIPRSEEGLRITRFEPGVSRGGAVTFDVDLVGEAELRVLITSPTGRAVGETRPSRAAGPTQLTWTARDRAGRPVPAGIYRVTLVAHSPDGEVRREVRMITIR